MIEWALIAFAATFPIATAAVKIHAARLKYKKWEAEQAQACPHVWSMWEKGLATRVFGGDGDKRPVTHHIRQERECAICGDLEYKTWDTATSAWLNN